jgi:hypothetical protein
VVPNERAARYEAPAQLLEVKGKQRERRKKENREKPKSAACTSLKTLFGQKGLPSCFKRDA